MSTDNPDQDTTHAVPPESGSEAPGQESDGTQLERWTYAGMRLSNKDTKLSAWIDPNGTELLYPHRAGRIVGCWYEVRVRRDADSAHTTMYGEPRFIGQSHDRELITRLAAEERADEQALAIIQRQRKAKQDNPLDATIDELVELIRNVPAPRRAGLTAYILYKLTRAW